MNYIIVDTNRFYFNFYLESMEWKRLLWLNQHEDYKIICPEFIFEEVIKKYSDTITAPLNGLKALKKYKGFQFLDISINKKDYYAAKYRERLKRIFEKNEIEIIPYPQSESYLKLIAEKYFKNKRPFGIEKPSFPDAIIWCSILDILAVDSITKIHFITANYKDFSLSKENKEVFHGDYFEELTADQIERVFLYENISNFISSKENAMEDLKDELRENLKEELKKKFEVSFVHFEDISKILGISLSDSDIQEVIEGDLSNASLEGEYFSGWGEDVCLDGTKEVNTVMVEFGDDFEAELIIELSTYANYSITTLNPMYEEYGDEEYLTENGYGSDFNIRISIFFKVNDSFYDANIELENRLDNFVKNYLEIDEIKFELF